MIARSRRPGSIATLLFVAASLGCAGFHPGAKLTGTRVPARIAAFNVTETKAAVIPPPGIVFSKSSAPLGVAPPVGGDLGSRSGRAVAHSIGLPPLPIRGFTGGFNLVTWGDATLARAQADGEITTPTHSEYESMVVLMLYRRMVITTYGD